MKKHGFLFRIVCLTAALSMLATSAFALSFSDVENDPTVSWAKDAIVEMTDLGYIKGYEDGTFKPYRAISKIECLLLMSRILGVEEDEFTEIAQNAKEVYQGTVSKYNTAYVNELCYLLYNGIITEADLVNYASSANANTELLRYQAAVLMAKMMGENTEASAYTVEAPTYPDNDQIPESARPYVEYVTQKGIMNGMAAEDGAVLFSPNTSLTRAQMATLLSRMIAKVNKSYATATITAMDLNNKTITMDSTKRSVNQDTVAYYDSKRVTLKNLQVDDKVGIFEVAGHMQMIQVLEAEEDTASGKTTSVYAVIANLNESSSEKQITLADPEDSSNTATYTVAENCTYTVDGSKATFGDLMKKDFVKATVKNGKIISVDVTDKDFVVNGTLVGIEYDDDDHVYVTVLEDETEVEQVYEVSQKGASVSRDGQTSEYRMLSTGDTVKLTLTSGKVTRIAATAKTESFTGVMNKIILATVPSVGVLIDGEEYIFELRADATLTVAGAEVSVYDLRPNVTVSGTLDGDKIKTLSADAVVTNQSGEFTGTVIGLNTSYKVINVEDANGQTYSVYYNTKTNFLKSNGSTASVKDIEKGATLSITGASNNGVFEATIIIIK